MNKHLSKPILVALACIAFLGLLIFAFSQSNNTPPIAPDATVVKEDTKPDDNDQPKQLEPTKQYDIRVNFSKNPESFNDFTYTQSVNRKTERKDMGTFALEQLIAGPTADEAASGMFSPLQNKFSGESNCSGADFSLAVSADGTATVKFCRDLVTAGIGEDALITETISKTLKQFSSVQKVIILDRNSHCFGDMSGEDKCLQ